MKAISLIMPVYNPPPDNLRGMLASIFASDGVDFELVAVNDGSTNGADAILREWDAAHPGRMKIIDRENRGAGPSRNEGFLAATGEYVWFVDADDGMRPGCLGEIVSLMEDNRAEHLLVNFDAAAQGSNPTFPDGAVSGVREVPKTFAFANFYRAPWKRVLRREFLSRIGVSFCNARTGQEDQAETLRWTLETDRLLYSDKVFYRYYIVPTSLSNCGHGPDEIESGLQVCSQFRELAERFSEHRDWMMFFSLLAASDNIKLCSDALARLSREADPPAEARARLESLREAYRHIAYGPPRIASCSTSTTEGANRHSMKKGRRSHRCMSPFDCSETVPRRPRGTSNGSRPTPRRPRRTSNGSRPAPRRPRRTSNGSRPAPRRPNDGSMPYFRLFPGGLRRHYAPFSPRLSGRTSAATRLEIRSIADASRFSSPKKKMRVADKRRMPMTAAWHTRNQPMATGHRVHSGSGSHGSFAAPICMRGHSWRT